MKIKIYPDNSLGTSFGSKHAQDTSAGTNIENYLILEQMTIVVHGIAVSKSPDFIF